MRDHGPAAPNTHSPFAIVHRAIEIPATRTTEISFVITALSHEALEGSARADAAPVRDNVGHTAGSFHAAVVARSIRINYATGRLFKK